MIGLGFTVFALVLACFCISVVYAVISGQHPSKFVRETITGFGLMMGGILALAAVVEILPILFGSR